MGVAVLSRREIVDRLPPESPIEDRMLSILEDGPGFGTRAGYVECRDWQTGLHALREEPELLKRHPLLALPQIGVLRYRADVLVVARTPYAKPGWHGDQEHAFFIECDGEEFHGADALPNDLRREREVARETGLPVLRFSGSEINFRPSEVYTVLEAKIEAMTAMQEFGPGVLPEPLLAGLRREVAALSGHPALRRQYHGRNAPPVPDSFHPSDPFGAAFRAEADTELDPFHALRSFQAALRHEVAHQRLAELQRNFARQRTDGPFLTEGLRGNDECSMRPLGDIMADVVSGLARRRSSLLG